MTPDHPSSVLCVATFPSETLGLIKGKVAHNLSENFFYIKLSGYDL